MCDNNNDLFYFDWEWETFVKNLFNMLPQDKNFFKIGLDSQDVGMANLLLYALQQGSLILFNKDFKEMNENEINLILKYFHSIGYNIKYTIDNDTLRLSFHPLN